MVRLPDGGQTDKKCMFVPTPMGSGMAVKRHGVPMELPYLFPQMVLSRLWMKT